MICFFYRIFLSRIFGEEGVGLYQLIFPIYTLGYSLTTAGIETAISRTVARKKSLGKEQEAHKDLYCGLALSFLLPCLSTVLLQKNTVFIADTLLGDARCAPLLTILSYAFPCSAVHSCICGYYYGLKQTKVPAAAQLRHQVGQLPLGLAQLCAKRPGQGGEGGVQMPVGAVQYFQSHSSTRSTFRHFPVSLSRVNSAPSSLVGPPAQR